MFKKRDRNEIRVIRHARVRKKISGTPEVPRLSVYRSNKHIQAQIIDDTKGVTLVSASTMDPALKGQLDEVARPWSSTAAGICIPAVWRVLPTVPVKPDSNSDKEDNARCNGLNRSANSKSVWLP